MCAADFSPHIFMTYFMFAEGPNIKNVRILQPWFQYFSRKISNLVARDSQNRVLIYFFFISLTEQTFGIHVG